MKRLLIVTHVPHHVSGGRIYAYGPYTREIDIWCDLFPEVVIAAPLHTGAPDADGLAISRDNVVMAPIPETGGETLAAKLIQLCLLPWIVLRLSWLMFRADAVHIRCPGNLGLLGAILGPIFCRRLIAKYAGQWSDYEGEAYTVRLQRRILSSKWWKGLVTVYGEWPNQPKHVIPFFTSVMTPEQIQRAKSIATTRRDESPFRAVFVGRLSREKNVDALIHSIASLNQEQIDAAATIVGHGAELERLESLARELNVEDRVDFVGGVEFDRVFDYYAKSHALVLVSETEGWPKVIAEAMACGLVCIGSNRGLVPWMLGEGRGFAVAPGDEKELTSVLKQLASNRAELEQIATKAAVFGQKYSLETLRDALADLFREHWGVECLPHQPETPANSTNVSQPEHSLT